MSEPYSLVTSFKNGLSSPTQDGCVLWTKFRSKQGYGVVCRNGAQLRAHRVAWFLSYGEIPDVMVVCHRCDNPSCVNVDHLFLGTLADNCHDRATKDRSAKGDSHGRSKLTEDIVRNARSRHAAGGVTYNDLAREYGVVDTVMRNAIVGKTWKSVK